MQRNFSITWLAVIFAVSLCTCSSANKSHPFPNIIIILADDMGYGDVQTFNSTSEIKTPNLNRLADEGIIFTDAHTPSSICTPTRYGLLTGRYCWRTSLKRGVLRGYDPPLIDEQRLTIADYLKGKGYRTGIVGKWHLGLGFRKKDESKDSEKVAFDLTKELENTPNDHGFDYSYILPASLDFEPYLYVKNRNVVDTQFDTVPTTEFPRFWREGIKSKSLDFQQVLDDLLKEATGFIRRVAPGNQPFFLYFPLTAPHKPVIPTEQFKDTTGKGPYGDFIAQIDWTVGEVINTLHESGVTENTLIIFTSDNGSPMYRIDSGEGPDHVSDETLAYYNASSHQANSSLRGIKGDTYEGGHRVPFVLRWPSKVEGGGRVNEAICLTDIFKTIVELTSGEISIANAEDSYSFLPLLTGSLAQHSRPPIIHHSGGQGMFAIRDGNWKLILGNGSGARTKPVGTPFERPYQLFDLEQDLMESKDLIEQEPEVAKNLESDLIMIKGDD